MRMCLEGGHSGERRRGEKYKIKESHLDMAGCARVGPPGSRKLIGSSAFSTLPERVDKERRLIRTKRAVSWSLFSFCIDAS